MPRGVVRRLAIPEDIEDFRDIRWWRDETRAIQTARDAERFIEQAGFAACLTDARRPGPSLYVAVCGRRDAVLPRHVQTDPEASHTWLLKSEGYATMPSHGTYRLAGSGGGPRPL